jgi:G3E family GTPase
MVSMIRQRIPTNIITGFLGSGKTTAILDLLQRKPADEKWAVLVNEFGEIGIDGAILANRGAEIREVPGGCICCVAGLPMQIALNRLIATAKPDRLLIEPTGLGHPRQIIDSLRGEYYRDVLDVRAVITLIDPRKLQQPRYREHAIFQDQWQIADVLIANKTDLCTAADENYFRDFVAACEPPKQANGWVAYGQLDPRWLDLPHAGPVTPARSFTPPGIASAANFDQSILSIELPPGELLVRREKSSDGFYSCGWLFADSIRFDFQQLFAWASGLTVMRLKGALRTDRGNFFLNAEEGVLSINDAGTGAENILEIIHDSAIDGAQMERTLLGLRCNQ